MKATQEQVNKLVDIMDFFADKATQYRYERRACYERMAEIDAEIAKLQKRRHELEGLVEDYEERIKENVSFERCVSHVVREIGSEDETISFDIGEVCDEEETLVIEEVYEEDDYIDDEE